MLIGLGVVIRDVQTPVIVFFLANLLSAGAPRSKSPLLAHPLKLSIVRSVLQFVNCNGFNTC
jgi:hypothetical protein